MRDQSAISPHGPCACDANNDSIRPWIPTAVCSVRGQYRKILQGNADAIEEEEMLRVGEGVGVRSDLVALTVQRDESGGCVRHGGRCVDICWKIQTLAKFQSGLLMT